MKLIINTQNLELLEAVRNKIEKSLRGLEKFTKRFGEKADLEVTLTKDTNHHETGDIFLAKAKFQIPGKDLFCEGKGSSLDEATSRLKDSLKRLIIENKKTKQSQWRKIVKIFWRGK